MQAGEDEGEEGEEGEEDEDDDDDDEMGGANAATSRSGSGRLDAGGEAGALACGEQPSATASTSATTSATTRREDNSYAHRGVARGGIGCMRLATDADADRARAAATIR